MVISWGLLKAVVHGGPRSEPDPLMHTVFNKHNQLSQLSRPSDSGCQDIFECIFKILHCVNFPGEILTILKKITVFESC